MANITPVPTYDGNTVVVLWETILDGDTGLSFLAFHMNDLSIAVNGTFGAGGSINMEGSNDGTNWHILTDPQGNAITKTAAFMEQITEACKLYRVNCTGGDGTTDLDAYLFGRKP